MQIRVRVRVSVVFFTLLIGCPESWFDFSSSCRFISVLCSSNLSIFFTMQLMQIRMLICFPSFRSFANTSSLFLNKSALSVAFSLACLEIRSRKEEAINSSRNRIYSLEFFYFLLYRRRYFLLVSELI